MLGVRMTVAGRSDVGRVRKNNEDAFTVTDLDSGTRFEASEGSHELDLLERGILLALSDGMGGHQAGEVASALVLDSLRKDMRSAGSGPIQQKIAAAVSRANAAVREASKSAEKHGMGATLTAVFVHGSEAYVAEVGDSRAYLLRGGRLRQITRDQTLVQAMVDQGVLSPDQAKKSAQKNIVLQAVGLADDVRVAIGRFEYRRGDRILICSDGVSNALAEDELRDLLSTATPKDACDRVIDLANERGGQDNATAIVAEFDGDGLQPPDPSESVTQAFKVLQAFDARLGGPPSVVTKVDETPELASAGVVESRSTAVAATEVGIPLPASPESRMVAAPARAGLSWLFVVIAVAVGVLGAFVYLFTGHGASR